MDYVDRPDLAPCNTLHFRGAVIGVAVSRDLSHWEVQPPLYAPYVCNAPEVSELFVLDGRTYLFFSHGETFSCRYRVADRWQGPYRCPPDDLLLAPWVYAPRSVVHEGNRYLVPWVADHLLGRDDPAPGRWTAAPSRGRRSRVWRGRCCRRPARTFASPAGSRWSRALPPA